jgi:translocation and assembly module TamB
LNSPRRRGPRARRWGRRLARLSGLSLLLLLALAALVLISVNLPYVRARLARELSRAASDAIAGTLQITRIGQIGIGSVSGVDAELLDPAGRRVLSLRELNVELDVGIALRGLIGKGPVTLAFRRSAVAQLAAHLHPGPDGEPSILGALEPTPNTADASEDPGDARPLHWVFERVTLREASLDGSLGDLEALDVRLRELQASGSVDESAAQFTLARLNVSARYRPKQPAGSAAQALDELECDLAAAGTLDLTAPPGAALALDAGAELTGVVGDLPVQARARYERGHISGYLELDANPSSLRRLWPDSVAQDPLRLFVGFDGELAHLELLALMRSGGGNLYVSGDVSFSPSVSGRLSVLCQELDLGDWLPDLPDSAIQLAAALRFDWQDGRLEAQLALRTWAVRVAKVRVPDLALSARWAGESIVGDLSFELAGAQVRAELELPSLRPASGYRRLRLKLEAGVQDLARVSDQLGLAAATRGRLTLQARAELELRALPSIVEAQLSLALQDVSAGPFSLDSATLRGSANGPLEDPRLGLSIEAQELVIPHYPMARLRLRAAGHLEELGIQARIEAARRRPVTLSARIFPNLESAREILLRAERDGTSAGVQISAARLTFGDSGVEVEGLEVTGAGRLQLDGSLVGERVRARGTAERFSPALLAERLGLQVNVPPGMADLSFSTDVRPGHVSGTLRGNLLALSAGSLKGGTIKTELEVQDNVVAGFAVICFPKLGKLQIDARELRLPARWAHTLTRLTGELDMLATLDLAELRSLADLPSLPGPRSGPARARLHLVGVAGASHQLRLALSTEGLGGSAPRRHTARTHAPSDSSVARDSTWQGADLQLTLELSGARLQAHAAVVDARGGLLAEAQAHTRVSLEQLERAPETIELRELPLQLSLQVPARQLSALPLPARLNGWDATLRAEASASGTLARPELTARVELSELKRPGRRRAVPLAVSAEATLKGRELRGSARVRDAEQRLLSLSAEADLDARDAALRLTPLALDLRSNGLPLQPLSALVGRRLSGELFGTLELANAASRTLKGTLWVNDPALAGFRQRQARWVVDADADSFSTSLELRQTDGHILATASGPWQWQTALVPVIEQEQLSLGLQAHGFQLEALRSVLPDEVRALSGRLDADLTLARGGGNDAAGNVHVQDGVIYVSALGQEFHDIELQASVLSSGEVQLERLSGRALRGRVHAQGQAQLDGFALAASSLVAQIPRNDPLPIMLGGVTVMDAWGRFEIQARSVAAPALPRSLEVTVAVPRLHMKLPEQLPRDVQQLEPEPSITQGTYLETGRFTALPLLKEAATEDRAEPLALRIAVELGDDIWIERGTQLEVKLVGSVELEEQHELHATGELRLSRGTINVQGRIFEIERGVITFVEATDPTNPTVVATARYLAPEGTNVYAEFVGPVKTGKLTLRSEPPLRDDQILSLLLFGTPNGNFGASSGSDNPLSGAAIAAGGSVVTRGLNQELSRLTSLDIQTRIGENQGEPQPEVVVQVTPRLTAELAYTMRTPNPGGAQDRTYLTLDLRLLRNWSLSTTIGDAGSLLLDLLWRHRY